MDELLRRFVAMGGSDLHLAEARRPKVRVHGYLEDLGIGPLNHEMMASLLSSVVDADRYARFVDSGDLDFAYEVAGTGRFRCNYLKNLGGLGAVFRAINSEVVPFEELGLPGALARMTEPEGGLILVTGPTGSGKSTTLASLVDHINRQREQHLILIEDPIEFVHRPKRSFITQREVGSHTRSFELALRAALREDPDIILVGELRDHETVGLALTAAEMGFLVFGTLHTNGAGKTVDRLIDVFPAERQGLVRDQLAAALLGVASQVLLRRRDGEGRVAAVEVLVANAGLRKLIRSGATHQIASFMQQHKGSGCQSMDDTIVTLVESGVVRREEALHHLRDPSRLFA